MAPRDDVLTRRRLSALTAPPVQPPAAPPALPPAAPPALPPARAPIPGGRHALRGAAVSPAPVLPDEPATELEETGFDAEPEPDADAAAEPRSRPWLSRRATERWVPEGLRGARWDPGRRGAVALAGVAAAAAVLAAVGVWRDQPVTESVPPLPVVAAAAQELPPLAADPPTAGSPTAGSPTAGSPTDEVPPAVATPPPPSPELVVSVAGAVTRPGLVRLPAGSRVDDALTAAGGPLPGTDLLSLNLAAPVADGEQVVVGVPGAPAVGGAAPAAPAGPAGAPGPAAGGGLVDLNAADLAALDALPGVGPVTAQKILDHRTEYGPFGSVDQLTEVPGIGDAKLASLRDLVTV